MAMMKRKLMEMEEGPFAFIYDKSEWMYDDDKSSEFMITIWDSYLDQWNKEHKTDYHMYDWLEQYIDYANKRVME